MAKYIVLRKFIDKDTKELYSVGSEIELTVKRAEEVSNKLDDSNGSYLERVSEKKAKKAKEAENEKAE